MSYNPYDPYGGFPMAMTEQAMRNAADMQIKEFEAKYKLGNAQLANAYKIAQLQSGSSRYATDATREVGLANIEQARQEMLQLGIPRLALDKWVAEKQQALAEGELDFKREQWSQQYGMQQGALTGYYQQNPTMAREEQEFRQGLAAGEATGMYGGTPTLSYREFLEKQQEQARRFGLDVGQATGYVNGMPTIEQGRLGVEQGRLGLSQEELRQRQLEEARRFGLDTAKFGAELASTPDTYYQAQAFQANDLPGLMGMAGTGTPYAGGPTPGVARMQQMLGPGMLEYQQPGTPPGAVTPESGWYGPGGTGVPGDPGGGGAPLSPAEAARAQAITSRRAQLAAAGEGDVSPEDAAELQRYQARGYRGAGPSPGAPMGLDDLGNPIGPVRAMPGGPSPYGGAAPGAAPLDSNSPEYARIQAAMASGQMTAQQGAAAWAQLTGQGPAEPGRMVGLGPGPDVGRTGGPIDQYGNPIGGGGYPVAAGGEPRFRISGGGGDQGGVPDAMGGGDAWRAQQGYGGVPMRYGGSAPRPYSPGYQPGGRQYPGGSVEIPTFAGGGGTPRPGGWGSGGAPDDLRPRQISQIAKTVPPSPYTGLSETDASALKLMESIYRQGGQSMEAGAYSRLKAQGRQGFLNSAGRMLGYDPRQLESQFQAYRPAQSSSRLA